MPESLEPRVRWRSRTSMSETKHGQLGAQKRVTRSHVEENWCRSAFMRKETSMSLWTRDRLHEIVSEQLCGRKLIVVSNREPYIHIRDSSGEIRCMTPASGLTTALDPILRSSGGVWIAHG